MGSVRMSALVVIAIAGHAYGQPSEPPPPADPNAPDPLYPPSPPPYPPPQPQPYPQVQPYTPPQPPPAKPEHDLICFAGRPFKCSSVLLLELGGRAGTRKRSVATADVGLLIQDGSNAYGATIGVLGISGDREEMTKGKEEAHLWYAARYRRYFWSWGLAADVSVGFAGGPALEVAIGWSDVIALTAGVNGYELEDGSRDTFASVGVRVGSVTIGGLLYLTFLAFASR